ncbi:hypothetical protein TWF106_000805 [Orbilia oligospora]|uniref:Uncharacterized protein n=1 Tax=Orbilia oligospora TaxID=2813651 RepID=A0A7C8QW18_ORBOL|nr:hypothetical protein TWF106_000805 [Orbilia oligospora]
MSGDNAPQSIEWSLFQNLGWYIHRRLQPFEHSSVAKSAKARHNRRKFRALEADLRHALLLENINITSPGDSNGPFLGVPKNGGESLAWIVHFLECHVNQKFLSLVDSKLGQTGSNQPLPIKPPQHMALSRLINCLKATAGGSDPDFNAINLVLKINGRPPMFSIKDLSTVRQALKKVRQLNAIFTRHQSQQISSSKKRSRSPTRQEECRETKTRIQKLGFRKHAQAALDAFYRFLPCGNPHKVLLRFQDEESSGSLDFFLSGCSTDEWQEVQCENYTPRNSICKVHNLCQTLRQRTETRLRMVIELLEDGSQTIHYSPQPSLRLYPKSYPSQSLEDLIKSRRLQSINFQNTFLPPIDLFSLKEKRTLALKLSLCFLNFFDSYFMKHSWAPAKIMFLILPNTKIQDSDFYITCSLEESYQQGRYRPGDPVLTSFARLLLEIDEGNTWPETDFDGNKIDISSPKATWANLCTYVEDAKQNRGQTPYLDAVTRILYLHKELNEIEDMVDYETTEKIDAKLRDLMYTNIVQLLELEVRPDVRGRLIGNFDGNTRNVLNEPTFERPHQRALTEIPESGVDDEMSFEPTPDVQTECHVAIVCALSLEATAMLGLFDEIYDKGSEAYHKKEGDRNAYTVGRIGNQNVVLCHLPGIGTSRASSAAANLRMSYTEIKIALIVGVCGAIPMLPDGKEIFLGDIIISDSVVKYDFGRQLPHKYERKSDKEEILGPVDKEIKALLSKLETQKSSELFCHDAAGALRTLQNGNNSEYRYPGRNNDILFTAEYPHQMYEGAQRTSGCIGCSSPGLACDEVRKRDCRTPGCQQKKIKRTRLEHSNTLPAIHIGRIASADTVMKSGQHRDELALNEGVIGFEMEGAGIWDQLPCVVIKGVCDYADTHKNKKWQPYAAATAAAGASAFLRFWASNTSRR